VRERVVRWVGVSLGAAGLAALAWYLVGALSTGAVVLDRLSIVPLLGSFALLALGYAAQATAWHALVRGQGMHLAWSQDTARWAMSLLGKYLPGKVFHAVGRVFVYRHDADEAAVTAAFAAEFVLGMSAACVASLIGLAIAPLPLTGVMRAALWTAAAVGLVTTFAGVPDRLVAWLARRVLRREVAPPSRGLARAGAFALSLAGHLIMGSGLLLVAKSLTPVDAALWPACVAAYCLSGIVGILAVFVPAGLGVRDVALAGLLGLRRAGAGRRVDCACRALLAHGGRPRRRCARLCRQEARTARDVGRAQGLTCARREITAARTSSSRWSARSPAAASGRS
jgi:hypothetical protein